MNTTFLKRLIGDIQSGTQGACDINELQRKKVASTVSELWPKKLLKSNHGYDIFCKMAFFMFLESI